MTMSILIILMVMQNNIQYYSIWGKKEHVCGLLWMKGFWVLLIGPWLGNTALHIFTVKVYCQWKINTGWWEDLFNAVTSTPPWGEDIDCWNSSTEMGTVFIWKSRSQSESEICHWRCFSNKGPGLQEESTEWVFTSKRLIRNYAKFIVRGN